MNKVYFIPMVTETSSIHITLLETSLLERFYFFKHFLRIIILFLMINIIQTFAFMQQKELKNHLWLYFIVAFKG